MFGKKKCDYPCDLTLIYYPGTKMEKRHLKPCTQKKLHWNSSRLEKLPILGGTKFLAQLKKKFNHIGVTSIIHDEGSHSIVIFWQAKTGLIVTVFYFPKMFFHSFVAYHEQDLLVPFLCTLRLTNSFQMSLILILKYPLSFLYLSYDWLLPSHIYIKPLIINIFIYASLIYTIQHISLHCHGD